MTAPLTNQELYKYFAGEGIAIGALDTTAVRGGNHVDTDGKIINRGAVKLNGQQGSRSSVTNYGRTEEYIRLLEPETVRDLRLMFGPDEKKPELRLVDEAETRARLGPHRMLMDETEVARSAYLAFIERFDNAGEDDSEERELQRFEGIGLQEELRERRRLLKLFDAVCVEWGGRHRIPLCYKGPNMAAIRYLERRMEAKLVTVQKRRGRPSIGRWLVELDCRKAENKELMQKMRKAAAERWSTRWDEWEAVRGPRIRVAPGAPAGYEPARKVWER